MRILYLCHRIPYPPDKGDKIRAFHELRAIASRHEVDLFTLADDVADLAHVPALQEYCRELHVLPLDPRFARLRALPFLLTARPLTVPYFYSAGLQSAVREALRRRAYDRVFVYCSAMAQYVEDVQGVPVVIDLVDVDSDKWAQYATFTRWPLSAVYRREAATLRSYERRIGERSSCLIVTTEREARLVDEICPNVRVHVICNGVDTEYFHPFTTPAGADAPTIGFVGDMSYFPNEQAVTHFVRTVLPVIRRRVPAARFVIAGRTPTLNVQKLGEIEGIEVTGFVPDIRTRLAEMRVSVAPFLVAAGIQNKILEAMSCALPVVATSRAVQGLAANCAAAVEVADCAEEMAATVVRLLLEPELARAKGLAGRSRVSQDYHWGRSLDRVLQVLERPGEAAACRVAPRIGTRW